MEENKATMSVQQALEITINNLNTVLLPVELIDQAMKIKTSISNIRECITVLNEGEEPQGIIKQEEASGEAEETEE